MFISKKIKEKGFTLIEILISIAIFTGIIGVFASFQTDIFSLNNFIDSGLKNQVEAKNVIKHFVKEVRSTSTSDQGAYPIKQADPDTFIFYSDINADGSKELVRYFVEGGFLKKGVVTPDGDPAEYDLNTEDVSKVVGNVQNTTPFTYYDETYTGGVDGILEESFMISKIRMVGINLIIDSDSDNPPQAFEISTEVNIRNLREK